MGSIINYIESYGTKDFKKVPFNKIDALILGILSYVDLGSVIKSKMTIKEAGDAFFEFYSRKQLRRNITGVVDAIKVLEVMKDAVRYKNLKLHHYINIPDHDTQFSAVCIDIDEKTTYISYEGTDELMAGWREDGEFSYKFPVKCHRGGIMYTNRVIRLFSRKKYILGGHSKGGHLALVSGMFLSLFKRKKLTAIYSFDGPGLRENEFYSRKYKNIEPIYKLIIPNQSIVGMMLNHHYNPEIVLSNRIGPLAHRYLSWQINDLDFVHAPLSKFSIKVDNGITQWLDKYSYKERKKCIQAVFAIFERAGIETLLDIKDAKLSSIMKILKEMKKVDEETRNMVLEFIKFMIENFS